jgi:oxygen-independent coproporphyrinogen III oxidase
MQLPVVDLKSLDAAIAGQCYSDYLYMYPPRQAYRALPATAEGTGDLIRSSLADQPDVNLYVHIPFCRQICRFCNLYTTSGSHQAALHDDYVDRVLAEAAAYSAQMLVPPGCRWRTLYLGGGTPSAFSISQLQRLVSGLQAAFPLDSVEETAIEVAPETATPEYLAGLRQVGFDRISMGFQSTSAREIRLIGRSYPVSRQSEVAAATLDLGFRNLCLDLIFGLPGQDAVTWQASLQAVIEMRPQTICCYQWTSRPNTGFARMGIARPPGVIMHELYDIACRELEAAGYAQETHVRWIKGGGGYLQKQYHWGMQTLLGLGAGARSYFWHADLRNGYSLGRRTDALEQYMRRDDDGWRGPGEGFIMSEDERRRKAAVLGIHALDRVWYRGLFQGDVADVFPEQIAGLADRGLIEVSSDYIRLTAQGRAYRDCVVQLFVSDNARSLAEGWTYDE